MYRHDRIRAKQAILRLTNEDLAIKSGLSRQRVSLLRDGKAEDPHLSSLAAVAKALGLELVELFEPRTPEEEREAALVSSDSDARKESEPATTRMAL